MLRFFSDYYKNRNQMQRVIENEIIERGDWVVIDESRMSEIDKRGFGKFLGQKGFVVGRAGGMIDIRFGNERTSILSGNLLLLDPKDKPTEKQAEKSAEKPTKDSKDKVDDMDPSLWPDDADDEI